MATTTTFFFLLLLVVATAAGVVPLVLAADTPKPDLSFFMHDITSGANPTAVKVIKGPGSTPTAPLLGMTFGDTTVMDDLLTETSDPASAALGRMQGIYMLSSQSGAALMVCANLLLTSGDHNGSTLAVMGRDDTGESVRELPVVGGTGKYRMAEGYVLWRTPDGVNGTDATVQIDVFLGAGAGNNGTDAGAPEASPGGDSGGAGGSSVGGSGSTKSSGSGGAGIRVNAYAWVVAVVVAVVGSWVR